MDFDGFAGKQTILFLKVCQCPPGSHLSVMFEIDIITNPDSSINLQPDQNRIFQGAQIVLYGILNKQLQGQRHNRSSSVFFSTFN